MRALRLRNIMRRAIVIAVSVAAVATVADAGERWQWSITPYVWASDISEDLIVDGEVVGGGDTEFSDLVDKLDTSLQLHFEGMGDRWGLFADVTYVELSDSQTGEMGVVRLDADIEETVLEGGVIWRPGGRPGRLDLLFGARLLEVDEDYRLQIGELDPFGLSVDESYLDALIALRYHIPLSQRWVISLRGDASFGDTDSVWTAQGMLGWLFGKNRNSAVLLGYRYRELEYTKADVIDVSKTLSGPGLAVKIGF
jgi:hypothetical protein